MFRLGTPCWTWSNWIVFFSQFFVWHFLFDMIIKNWFVSADFCLTIVFFFIGNFFDFRNNLLWFGTFLFQHLKGSDFFPPSKAPLPKHDVEEDVSLMTFSQASSGVIKWDPFWGDQKMQMYRDFVGFPNGKKCMKFGLNLVSYNDPWSWKSGHFFRSAISSSSDLPAVPLSSEGWKDCGFTNDLRSGSQATRAAPPRYGVHARRHYKPLLPLESWEGKTPIPRCACWVGGVFFCSLRILHRTFSRQISVHRFKHHPSLKRINHLKQTFMTLGSMLIFQSVAFESPLNEDLGCVFYMFLFTIS